MKKVLLGIVALLLAGSLVACGTTVETEGESAEVETSTEVVTENAELDGVFSVGYACLAMTPDYSVPLHGYGNVLKRMSDGYLDDICVTCTAITDESGYTILVFNFDLSNIVASSVGDSLIERVSEATGVENDHIIYNCSHTHSSISLEAASSDAVLQFREELKDKAVEAALAALDDRTKTTKMYYGVCDLTGFNFVKHYFTDLDESVGDNHGGYATGVINRHTTEANHEMYLVRFERENAQDVLWANFRGHPILTGGSAKTDISADIVYPLRWHLEEDSDVLLAYFQGESGNQNLTTRLAGEENHGSEYLQWGLDCAAKIEETLANGMTEIPLGAVRTEKRYLTLQYNHADDSKVAQVSAINTYWTTTNDRVGIWQMCWDAGFESPYHTGAIARRATYGKEADDIQYHVTLIGELAITMASFETFDTNGTWIRENAPTEYVFCCGYSCDSRGYMPSQYAFEYGCYEADTCSFVAGSAEILATAQLNLLKEMWSEK